MNNFLKLAKEGEKIMRKLGIKPYKYPKTIVFKKVFKVSK